MAAIDGEAMIRGLATNNRPSRLVVLLGGLALIATGHSLAHGQQASVSAWDAADFRIWGYIPYWATNTQITNFATNGIYSHVSDVLYFGGLRPDPNGNLAWASSAYQ